MNISNRSDMDVVTLKVKTAYDVAVAELNKDATETLSAGHDIRVLEYYRHAFLDSAIDKVPWNSAFICFCLETAGFKSTNSAAAVSFLKYGTPVANEEIKQGDVVVFKRIGGYHVAFFQKWATDGNLYALGANELECVCTTKFNLINLLAIKRITT